MAATGTQIPLIVDFSGRETLVEQLTEQLKNSVLLGRLPLGSRIPSTRQLASQLGVSRNTVIRAFEILVADGFFEAKQGCGYFASSTPPTPESRGGRSNERYKDADPGRMTPPVRDFGLLQRADRNNNRLSYDFEIGASASALFPGKAWRRTLQSLLSGATRNGPSREIDPVGLAALRRALAEHLAVTRGIVADPWRLIITTGAQEGIDLAARLLLGPGRLGIIEDPGMALVANTFRLSGAEIQCIKVDADGLDPELLPARAAALLHVTPSHQFPTGSVLSRSRRSELVKWARRHGCYILEDDRDGDFCYDGSPLPAIAAGAADCTLYAGTFSRTLGPGVRLGYLVVPEQLFEPLSAIKTLLNLGNSWMEQAVLAEMINNNSYAVHLNRAREHYRHNRDALLESLCKVFGEANVSGLSGGLHVMWYLPPGVPDASIVEQIGRRNRIGIRSLASSGATIHRATGLVERAMLLGFGSLTPRLAMQGLSRLSDAIDDELDDPEADVISLFASTSISTNNSRASHEPPKKRRGKSAIRRRDQANASSKIPQEGGIPVAQIESLFRYPVKGLSGQALESIQMTKNGTVPGDRVFALVRPGAPVDPANPKWAKKSLFCMLMLDEGLARVQTSLDLETWRFSVSNGSRKLLDLDITSAHGKKELEQFFWELIPTLPAAPILVHSKQGHFMDKPDNVVSLINLASVRDLEKRWNVAIDPMRFRANIYIDGAPAWEEFKWVGQSLNIGGVRFRVDRRNGRCGATNVNPATARRDLDIPASLRATFGHKDLGVYLVAESDGQISISDSLSLIGEEKQFPVLMPAPSEVDKGKPRFICSGCYFIYDETRGLPQQGISPNTAFTAIAKDWRCPDCGGEKSLFRPA